MIKHDWILSVLDDLQLYAEENGLLVIAVAIAKDKKIARCEIETKEFLDVQNQMEVNTESYVACSFDDSNVAFKQCKGEYPKLCV